MSVLAVSSFHGDACAGLQPSAGLPILGRVLLPSPCAQGAAGRVA